MGRVKASMAEVSTDFNPMRPGVYDFEITKVTEDTNKDTQRTKYTVENKVVGLVSDGEQEAVGRNIRDAIHIHKRDGELNEIGLAQLKRYFEVTVGEERANAEDADTDELVHQRFRGQVVIESYTVEDALTGKKEERKKNTISRFAPIE
jgi:hypothetical protein